MYTEGAAHTIVHDMIVPQDIRYIVRSHRIYDTVDTSVFIVRGTYDGAGV